MKAITLHQPWATLVVTGHKSIETRSWRPGRDAIGKPLAIHAALAVPPDYSMEHHLYSRCCQIFGMGWQDRLPRGKVLCVVDLAAVERIKWNTRLPPLEELVFGDYTRCRWMWRLENVRPVEPPQPARGWQGMWTWEPESQPTEVQP